MAEKSIHMHLSRNRRRSEWLLRIFRFVFKLDRKFPTQKIVFITLNVIMVYDILNDFPVFLFPRYIFTHERARYQNIWIWKYFIENFAKRMLSVLKYDNSWKFLLIEKISFSFSSPNFEKIISINWKCKLTKLNVWCSEFRDDLCLVKLRWKKVTKLNFLHFLVFNDHFSRFSEKKLWSFWWMDRFVWFKKRYVM